MRTRLTAGLALLLLAACSSEIVVSELPASTPPGSSVDGIPFRMPKRFKAVVYEKRPGGYKPIYDQPVTIADPYHLYVLNFKGQPFADSSLDLAFNPDNTIKQLELKSTSKMPETVTAAGGQAAAVVSAIEARRTTEAGRVTASASLVIAAEEAKQAADLAALQHQLAKSKAETSPEDLLRAEQKERLSKLKANEAARLAGIAPYFPDASAGS